MAAAMDAEKWSDEYKDPKCSICAKKKRDQTADYYCSDCNKHLCTSCLGFHNDFNENHNVVKGHGDNKDVLTEKCGKHADELITLYCRQDDELLCRKCCLLDHRKCQDPKNIRESSDELNADPELQAVPEQLKSALENINKAIKALDKHVANIQHSGDGFLKDLEDYAKKLLSRIEELRERSKKDIKSKQEVLLAVAKQHRQACAVTKDEISQCLDKITKSKNWKANMFVLKKKGKIIAQKVDSLYNESDSVIKGCQFNFLADMKVFDSLNFFNSLIEEDSTRVQDVSSQCAVEGEVDKPVQATLKRPGEKQDEMPVVRPGEKQGEMSVVRPGEKQGEMPVVRPGEKQGEMPVVRSGEKQGDMSMVRPGKKPSVEQALYSKQVRKFNICIPEDKTSCWIYGCCHLSDGSLVVADFNNSRLKLVDLSRNTVTKYCGTDGQPIDICCIGPQEVAVAFGSTQVEVYNTVSLTRTRTVELGHNTDWIAYHGGLLYCAGWYGTILYVHDVRSGRKLREISMDTDGRKLFSDIRHIAVNSSGDRVYVADWGRGLVCVDTDGRPIFCLSNKDLGLSGAWGVTTDHHGHVFVSGYKSHNVVKVTEDGHVVGQILSKEDGIPWCPSCLSYDVSRSSLYVGGLNSDQLLMVEWK